MLEGEKNSHYGKAQQVRLQDLPVQEPQCSLIKTNTKNVREASKDDEEQKKLKQ